ncbi:ATP-binding protein [Adlercreutzia sp. R21]|uniref:ATP-binding protein n=1 Tax=Adlercreutzia wanghongyangiae TaxID=3111451 RepID=A0ABU6IFG7_9ACTN|nr:ATP-binding protein [Adlercreutzia sp. R21]MEC4175173.1 ATP-binding protein [Adlercreutzia sp. R7]MEC4184501.1 ATP-binding protein [Adlercreutzia sp. R21]
METESVQHGTAVTAFDYTFVDTVGHIAIYDDMRSEPRVIDIQPAETAAYIEALATGVYEQARGAGGSIPYTVIREVSENFIHAQFKEALVTILDHGNTIRFADHGPGIPSKEKAQMPGFSSAVEPMRNYIRGVGSGLPRVREYLELSNGTITIEDNLGTGAVVTISLVRDNPSVDESDPDFDDYRYEPAGAVAEVPLAATTPAAAPYPYPAAVAPAYAPPAAPAYAAYPSQPAPYPSPQPYGAATYAAPQPVPYPAYQAAPTTVPYGYPPAHTAPAPHLSERDKQLLSILRTDGPQRDADLSRLTDIPGSTTHNMMKKLEEAGLVSSVRGLKSLTDYGNYIAQSF